MATATDGDRATFLYDDCCPLCRTYTASFAALGWAERAPFSQVSDATLNALDMDRARHHIPLHDLATGQTKYGLDGILDVVEGNAPLLGAAGKQRHVRFGLDKLYYFISYNRRHIISAPPPVVGFDCAPDFEPKHIKGYLCFCAVTVSLLGRAAPIPVVVAGLAASRLVATRNESWNIKPLEAAGHAASVTTAAAGAAAIAKALTSSSGVAAVAAAVVGARKVYLRRWMRTNPALTPAGVTQAVATQAVATQAVAVGTEEDVARTGFRRGSSRKLYYPGTAEVLALAALRSFGSATVWDRRGFSSDSRSGARRTTRRLNGL